MAPPNPKNPPKRRGPGVPTVVKKPSVEVPLDERDVAPLRADDPRPQRVPQYPARFLKHSVRAERDDVAPTVAAKPFEDESFASQYDEGEISDPGFRPAFLYVERGPGTGQLIPIKQGAMVLGRASVSDLRLQHSSVSRRHAQLTRSGERFYVKDLGSQNGTFVNRVRVTAETEIGIGDQIAVGTALLKLRGPQRVERPQPQPVRKDPVEPTAKVNRFFSVAALKVGAAGLAIGFCLAGLLLFALARGSGSRAPATPSQPSAVGQKAVQPGNLAIARQPSEAAVPTQPGPVGEVAADRPTEPPARAVAGPAEGADQPRPKATVARVQKESRSENAPEPAKSIAKAPTDSAVLARYEVGNVTAAIDLARKQGNSALERKLIAFREHYEAGMQALTARDGTSAIQNLGEAAEIDEEISTGWGKYGEELRSKLSDLYVIAGNRHLEQSHPADAKKAFEAALRYNPSNATARASLGKIKADKGQAGRRDTRIEDAFEERAAPSPKSATGAQKKPLSASDIDAAFDD